MLLTALRGRMAHSRGDAGQALVMVLTMMVMMAGILALLATSAVFGISVTSQTRASVESIAAAEGGINVIGAAIQNGECVTDANGHVSSLTTTPAFEADVYHQTSPTSSWQLGCPSEGDYGYRVVATGYAAAKGLPGFDLGDVETLEAAWIANVQPPRFEHAVRGDSGVSTAGFAGVFSSDGDADIYTHDDFECPSGAVVEGSVIAGGDVRWNQSTCRVAGDLYVGGDIVYPVSPGAQPNVGGDLVVGGSIMSNNNQTSFSFINDNQYINVAGSVTAGGLIHAYCSYPGYAPNSNWSGYSGWDAGRCDDVTGTRVRIRTTETIADTSTPFEPIYADSEPFVGWHEENWKTMELSQGGLYTTGRTVTGGGVCQGHPWYGRMEINVTQDTFIDTTGYCNQVALGTYGDGLTINMSGDLVIFGNYFYQNGLIDINSVDGQEHSLYLIDTPTAGFSSCPATVPDPSTSTGGFTFSSGTWNQDPEIAVLLYTPGKVKVGRSNFVLGGQVYSCESHFASGFYLDFRRVGDVSDSAGGLDSYDLAYLRRS